jgi:hypothetical protein
VVLVSEVETRLAEIRERVEGRRDHLVASGRSLACSIMLPTEDTLWLLDQLARVRTDTIEECATIAEKMWANSGDLWAIGYNRCAVDTAFELRRGVSHEH